MRPFINDKIRYNESSQCYQLNSMCPILEKYWLYSSVGKDAWELMSATHSHLWIVLSPTCRSDHSHPRWWRGVWPSDYVDHLSHNAEISLPNKLQIMNQNSFHVISLSKNLIELLLDAPNWLMLFYHPHTLEKCKRKKNGFGQHLFINSTPFPLHNYSAHKGFWNVVLRVGYAVGYFMQAYINNLVH